MIALAPVTGTPSTVTAAPVVEAVYVVVAAIETLRGVVSNKVTPLSV